MSEALPRLLDARALRDELGLRTIDQAYSVMAHVPKVRIGRRVFVDASDVAALIAANKTTARGIPLRSSS